MADFKICLFITLLLGTIVNPLNAADSRNKDKQASVTTFKSLSEPLGKTIKYIPLQQLTKNRALLAIGSTLYMLNGKREPQWKFDAKADINSFAYVPKFDTVYVMATDLTWVSVDAKTGKKKWAKGSNGRATYGEIRSLGIYKYVVVADMSGYDSDYMHCREKNQNHPGMKCARTLPDSIELYQDKERLGGANFPHDAHLAVLGDHVWAITTGKETGSVTEISFAKKTQSSPN